MFYAGGNTIFWNPTQNAIVHVQPSVLSISGESETAQGRGVPWSPGAIQVLASAQISSTISATLSIQKVSAADMALVLNTQLAQLSSFQYPVPFQTTVSGGNTIAITGLTADQPVVVNVTQNGVQRKLTQIASSGTPATDEYEVTANTITFAAGAAGQLVTGVYFETVTGPKTVLGGSTPSTSFGTLSFFGKILGTEDNADIYIKQYAPDGVFDLGLIGSAGEDINVNGTLSTAPGDNRPYFIVFNR